LFLFNLFRVFNAFLSLFPASFRKQFFFSLARLAYIIDKKHRKVIGTNLDIAGIKEKIQRKKIALYCYKNLLLNLFQTIRNTQISADEANMDIELVNTKVVEEANAQNRPIIFVTAHYGNWEMLGMALVKSVEKINIVYKKLNNDYFDQYLHNTRASNGVTMIEKRGALRGITKAMKNKESLWLLIDQNTSVRDGIVVNFFNKDARASATAAQIARKYNAAIIPVFITSEDEKKYTVSFKALIEVEKTDDAKEDILKATQAQSDAIESQIKEEPKFWFWCHKRWKTEDPEIYKY